VNILDLRKILFCEIGYRGVLRRCTCIKCCIWTWRL